MDPSALKNRIDKNLIALISRYDAKEEPLRREEAYLQTVKRLDGDIESAKRVILASEMQRREETLNLVEQMADAIKGSEGSPSEKKTAVSFLGSYIRKGFDSLFKFYLLALVPAVAAQYDGAKKIVRNYEENPVTSIVA